MGHGLSRLAQRYGTPLYVYSFERVSQNLQALRSAFSRPLRVHYAVKANFHHGLLKKLKKLNVGVDVVSGGEIKRALECGFKGQDIIFSGVAKSEEEIKFSLRQGIHIFNVESPQELIRIGQIARALKKVASVSFRLNPNVNPKTHPYITTGFRENKFGMDKSYFPELLKIVRKYSPRLALVGLDFHIGSQLLDIAPFEEAVRRAVPLFKDLQSLGYPMKHFDIGGGTGIPYEGKKSFNMAAYGRRMEALLKDVDAEILCEPGRYLVGDAGVLLTKVEYVKKNPYKTFVIVNTGMHHLMRPALYQAFHKILPIKEKYKNMGKVDVVGPICESSDWLAQKRPMPQVSPGEILAICDTGAYGYVMASDYNLHDKPTEILLD